MRAPAILLAFLCIAVGLLPGLLVEKIVNSTTQASTQNFAFEGTHLALWHGINLPLVMSIIAIFGGAIFYFALAKGGAIREIDLDPKLGKLQGRVLFDLFLKNLLLNSRRFAVRLKMANCKVTFCGLCCLRLAWWAIHL